MNGAYSRRKFIHKYFLLSSALLGIGIVLNGCDQKKSTTKEDKNAAAPDSCSDFSGVSETDLKAREKLGYVKESPIEDRTCNNCNLWLPPPANEQCGKCMLFKGPVYSAGYCTYWAARQDK